MINTSTWHNCNLHPCKLELKQKLNRSQTCIKIQKKTSLYILESMHVDFQIYPFLRTSEQKKNLGSTVLTYKHQLLQ